MAEFRVTFGDIYRNNKHPKVGWAHPDGYVTVEAKDEDEARLKIFALLGPHWAFLWPAEEFDTKIFPLGELYRLT